MADKNIKTLVYSALFTALVTVATAYLKIPTAIGYLNLGDGFIFAAGVVLGPIAAVVGGIGSMIADLMAGYMIYAPITLLIKGCMGLAAGLMYRAMGHKKAGLILSGLPSELIMVFGYFLFEAALLGQGLGAAVGIPANLLQGAFGLVAATLLTGVLRRNSYVRKAYPAL